MNDGEPGPVHQILLGLKGREGVTVVAHSMASAEEASSWQTRLEKHVRLLPWETKTALPEKALSYYQFGSRAVVLRRWAVGGSLGRSDAHALIGPIDVLTVPVALGLDSGLDWQGAAGAVKTSLAGDELTSLAQAAVVELRRHAMHKPEILRRALGMLIDAPGKPLTIIGCPDDERVALTWALVHVGNEYLTKACRKNRRWTFSTYEIEDTDGIPNLPEILFMPGKPIGRGVASRGIVDVRRNEVLTSMANEWSASLVERFVADEPLLPEFDDSTLVPVPEMAPPAAVRSEPREQESTSSRPVPDRWPHQAGSGGYPKESGQGTAGHFPTSRGQAEHRFYSKRVEKEIHELLRAENEHEFNLRLGALGRTFEERVEIRRLLGIDNYLKAIAMIMSWYPPMENISERFQRFRVVTFGSSGRDLSDPDAVEFAVRIVEHSATPDLFVHGLVQEIDARGQSDRVNPALATRWREQNKTVLDLTEAPFDGYRATGPLSAVMSVLSRGGWPLAASAVIVLLAPLFFVLGRYSVDTGVDTGTAAAGSSGAGSQVTPSVSPDQLGTSAGEDPANGRASEVSGGITTKNLMIQVPRQATDGQSVFLLLRTVADGKIHPQGQCDAREDKWVCEKLTPPEGGSAPFDALVVKVDQNAVQSYQEAVNTKKELSIQLDPKAVIYQVAVS